MKKILIAIFALVVLAGCDMKPDNVALEAAEKTWYKRNIPAGAELLELVPRAAGGWGYAIIEFRDECFVLRSAGHGLAMANIKCTGS